MNVPGKGLHAWEIYSVFHWRGNQFSCGFG
jgi:hypothetical protein